MTQGIAFENDKYMKEQTSEILDRVKRFDDKLYLEFGGKLLYDYHASRVLPGYDPNLKMRLLLKDGAIVTGSNPPRLHAASSLILHAAKHLTGIPEKIKLLPPFIIESVRNLKMDVLNEKTLSLDLLEALIALSISAATNPAAQIAVEKLNELRGCEVHMTHMPTPGDEAGLRRLGVNLTNDPNFSTKDLFIS